MIDFLTGFFYYTSLIILIVLAIKLLWEVASGQKGKTLKSIKILFNVSSITIFCWGLFLSFGIIVRPPFEVKGTLNDNLGRLSDWIIFEEIKYGFIGVAVIFFVGILSYVYQAKIEKEKSFKAPILLGLINLIILSITLFLTYVHTNVGLSQEISYHFK